MLGAACLVGILAPGLLERHQLLVLAAGFLIGLPHGAVDHLVPFWTGWVRRRTTTVLAVLLAYVGVAAAAWSGLRWAGAVVLPVLLVLSVVHFGAGDLAAAREARPDRRRATPARSALAVLAHGGPVVAGPLLVWPEESRTALAAVAVGFEVPSAPARILLGVLVEACVVLTAVVSLRAGDTAGAGEVVLLATLFVVVPPLAAFGVYFGAWHGLRHTGRLIACDPRNRSDLAAGRLARPTGRFLTSAALPTAVAAATAAGLVVLAGQRADLTGTVFTVLLALTVPHLLVVAVLDTRKGVRHMRVS